MVAKYHGGDVRSCSRQASFSYGSYCSRELVIVQQLGAHVVIGLADAGLAAFRRVQPFSADEGEQRVALFERGDDRFFEFLSAPDGIHVDEDIGWRQKSAQPVIDAPGSRCGVLAPIADEYPLGHSIICSGPAAWARLPLPG